MLKPKGLDLILKDYTEILSLEDDNVVFIIKPIIYNCDDLKIFDNSLLLCLVDANASFAAIFLCKEHRYNISLSLNFKMISFEEMYLDRVYRMVVKLKNQKGKYLMLETEILNEKGELIKILTLYKRLVKNTYGNF